MVPTRRSADSSADGAPNPHWRPVEPALRLLHGTIAQRVGLLTGSGGTSTDEFGRQFDAALADRDVAGILIDADTPGGSVFGVHGLSQKIFESRGKKPIVAIANSEACSTGYYVASAADELWITPSGMVGSIGGGVLDARGLE